MKNARYKEAPTLAARIILLQHIEDVLHCGSLSKMPRATLLAHLKAVIKAGYSWPFNVRLQLMQKHMEDILRSMQKDKGQLEQEGKDAGTKVSLETLAPKWLTLIAVWEKPKVSMDETDMTFRWVLDARVDELRYARKFKSMSEQEFQDSFDKAHQDRWQMDKTQP